MAQYFILTNLDPNSLGNQGSNPISIYFEVKSVQLFCKCILEQAAKAGRILAGMITLPLVMDSVQTYYQECQMEQFIKSSGFRYSPNI